MFCLFRRYSSESVGRPIEYLDLAIGLEILNLSVSFSHERFNSSPASNKPLSYNKVSEELLPPFKSPSSAKPEYL